MQVKVFNAIDEVPEAWNHLVVHDVLLEYNYLKALEVASPKNITLYYLGVYKSDHLVGVAVVQHVQLYLKEMFRDRNSHFLKVFFQQCISAVLKGNILVVGNITHTGQHGFFFDPKKISRDEFQHALLHGISKIELIVAQQKKKIRFVMLKDFFEDTDFVNPDTLKHQKWHRVAVQPNMIMSLSDSWNSNEDYIAAMHKKYRDRYKRAKKKLNGIICREMDLNDIMINSKQLYQLYLNVSNQAKFNTFVLPEQHFYVYKLHLKEHFRVFGYYLNGKLIGFFTLILNYTQLETYFLGYDSKNQQTHQLYLNMLYDMAKFGIEHGFKRIVYARTAMAIKSSVGAKPIPMLLYVKHKNQLLNAVLKPLFRFMKPAADWEERHPFK